MLFYVPPLLPVMATVKQVDNTAQSEKMNPIAKYWDDNWLYDTITKELWGTLDQVRFPLKYLASLLSAGDEEMIKDKTTSPKNSNLSLDSIATLTSFKKER